MLKKKKIEEEFEWFATQEKKTSLSFALLHFWLYFFKSSALLYRKRIEDFYKILIAVVDAYK